MKTQLKRIAIMLLAVSMFFSACQNVKTVSPTPSATVLPSPTVLKTEAQLFDAFLKERFIKRVTNNTFTLHDYLQKPEDFGIMDYEVTWGDDGIYPSEEEIKQDRLEIEKFRQFDRKKLTLEQQGSYDILAYNYALYDTYLDTFFYQEPLKGDVGFHAFLPIMLSEFEFINEKDVQDYLELCSLIGKETDKIIHFEKEKAEKGLFMSDEAAQRVVEACGEFLNEKENNIIIKSFNDKIDKMKGLSSIAKLNFKGENKTNFTEVIIPAYEKLKTEMSALKGSGRNSGGLANFEKGKDYYILRLKSMGCSYTPEEYIDLCDKQISSVYNEIITLVNNNPKKNYKEQIAPKLTPEKMMDYLKEKSAADFPPLPADVTFSLKIIDKSMEENLPPAFYFKPQLDNYKSNSVYYNADRMAKDSNKMYNVFSHEGYPGHLLQHAGLYSSPLSYYRKIVSFTSYGEGFATYAEYYTYKYLSADETLKRYHILNAQLGRLISFRVDLGVNYQGWTLDDLIKNMKKKLPYMDKAKNEIFKNWFDSPVNNAMRSVPYAAGYLEIAELKDYLKKKTGGSFIEKTFHEELLKRGEAPFSLIKKWMEDALSSKALLAPYAMMPKPAA